LSGANRGLVLAGLLAASAIASAVGGWLVLRTPAAPSVRGTARIERARAAYLERDLVGAEAMLRELLRENSEDRPAGRLLGRVLAERGRLAASKEIFEGLLKGDAKDVDALRGLAQVFRAMGQPRSAVPWLDQAIGLRKEDAGLWKELGSAQREAGDTMGAFTSVQKSLSLDPQQEDLSMELAELLRSAPAGGAPGQPGSSLLSDPMNPNTPEAVLRNPNRPRSPGVDPFMPSGTRAGPR